MAIVSVFYAAFGYLALLGAILWSMLFVGDDVSFPSMDAAGTAAPLQAALVDLGVLLVLAFLYRSVNRGMLRHFAQRSIPRGLQRSTQAWVAAAVLMLIYAGWQPLPQLLWIATGPPQWALCALFYLGWTLILIGAFLASHMEVFGVAGATGMTSSPGTDDSGHAQAPWTVPYTHTLTQPLYGGVLIAMWAASVMTVGRLLLATAVTAYLLLDGLWAARSIRAARQPRLVTPEPAHRGLAHDPDPARR